MSNVQVETKSIVTIPASTSKLITGVNVAGIIQSVLPAGITGTIKPRDISMSHETARAAIGAKASPKAIIVGLSYLTLAYAYGQGKPETLSKDCPKWATHGLELACQYFKAGAGNVTVDALSTAVQSAVDTLLALPKPEKAKKVNGPVAVVQAVPETIQESGVDEKTGRITSHSLAFGHEAHEDNIRSADVSEMSRDAISAKAEEIALAHAKDQRDNEAIDVIRLIAEMSDREQAITLVRAMAAHFGYTLVNMELSAKVAA